MRQGTVSQFRVDLHDDGVSAVHVISSDSVETFSFDGGAAPPACGERTRGNGTSRTTDLARWIPWSR